MDSENNIVGLTSSIGSVQLNADGTFLWSYLGVDDLNSTVTVTATDAFGAASTSSFSVIVSNVTPTLGGRSIAVNQATKSVALNTSVSDIGLADTHLFTIQWGDGSSNSFAPDGLRNLLVRINTRLVGLRQSPTLQRMMTAAARQLLLSSSIFLRQFKLTQTR